MRDQNLNKRKTIKELKGPTPHVRQFLGSESQLKMIKDALKVLRVFKIIKFLSQRFCSCRKTKLISTFMAPSTRKQIVTAHMLLIIS